MRTLRLRAPQPQDESGKKVSWGSVTSCRPTNGGIKVLQPLNVYVRRVSVCHMVKMNGVKLSYSVNRYKAPTVYNVTLWLMEL